MSKNFLKLMVSVLGIGIMVSSCEGCKERKQKETLFNNGILVAYKVFMDRTMVVSLIMI